MKTKGFCFQLPLINIRRKSAKMNLNRRKIVGVSLGGRSRELKNKAKDQLVIPKSGRGPLRERSLTRAFNYRV